MNASDAEVVMAIVAVAGVLGTIVWSVSEVFRRLSNSELRHDGHDLLNRDTQRLLRENMLVVARLEERTRDL